MPTIIPFCAISPDAAYADQLIFNTRDKGQPHAGKGFSAPLKQVLETVARNYPETPEAQLAAYREIGLTLQELLKAGQLSRDEQAGFYVYETMQHGHRQSGIWALTLLDEAADIKIHELTFADSLRRLKNYREHTRLEGSPILLTYQPHKDISRMIANAKLAEPNLLLNDLDCEHRIWAITAPALIDQLTTAFASVRTVYLADGHHRLSSAQALAVEQSENGRQVLNTLSSLLIDFDQLQIMAYHRAVLPPTAWDRAAFMDALCKNFIVEASPQNYQVRPAEAHQIGMQLDGIWFCLTVRPAAYLSQSIAGQLDVALLQELILAPLLGIEDPKNDTRLKCVGGPDAFEQIDIICSQHPEAVVFTLSALTTQQLTRVADAGEVLPPKSTWINPKIPYGLLLYQHSIFHYETT